MTLLQASLLGLLQGLAEFLPISSSGHLVLAEALLQARSAAESSTLFEVLVHAGTLGSIVTVMWRDTLGLLRGLLRLALHPRATWRRRRDDPDAGLALTVVVGSLPAGLTVLLLRHHLEAAFHSVTLVGVCLMVTGAALAATHWLRPGDRQVGPGRALLVGMGQALALLPGISRSGATIAMALALGVRREEAGRFSFVLAIPAVAGAAGLHLVEMWREPPPALMLQASLVAGLVAYAVGCGALVLLLRVVRQGRLSWFAPYCLAVGALALGWSLL